MQNKAGGGWLAELAEVGDAAGDEDGLVTRLAGARSQLGRCRPDRGLAGWQWRLAVEAASYRGAEALDERGGARRQGRG